jgi:bifunctional non-homologous end joining protein LigD
MIPMIPLGARYTYEDSRTLGHLLAQIIVRELPAITTVQRKIDRRQGKVYIDHLQNRRGQLIVAPYSVRPLPGASVSAPLRWREVKPGLKIGTYTSRTLPRRVRRMKDDPVRPVLEMSPESGGRVGSGAGDRGNELQADPAGCLQCAMEPPTAALTASSAARRTCPSLH